MPLSKKRMRDRKKVDRSNLNDAVQRGSIPSGVTVDRDELYPPPISAVALLKLQDVKPTSNPTDPQSFKPNVPFYNPKKHKEGDVVRKWSNGKWVEVTVLALDMDGNVIGGM